MVIPAFYSPQFNHTTFRCQVKLVSTIVQSLPAESSNANKLPTMEHLVKAFTRVVRKIDDGNVVINLFPKPDEPAASNPSSRTDLDRRRILEFPDAETQSSNIAASSSLDKASLLKRAAESPSELTTSEIDLLKERYWLGISRNETKARSLASSALLAVSEDHWRETTKRLKEVRGPLYEENEAKAIENADSDAWRRRSEASRGRQEEEAEAALGRARGSGGFGRRIKRGKRGDMRCSSSRKYYGWNIWTSTRLGEMRQLSSR